MQYYLSGRQYISHPELAMTRNALTSADGFTASPAVPVRRSEFELPQPYLLFLGAPADAAFAKTAFGLADWARERCVGEFACDGTKTTVGLPRMIPAEARAAGARSVVIGVASIGGAVARNWIGPLVACLEAGLDLVSGTHGRLENTPELKAAAERYGRALINVRTPPSNIPIATGRKRTGKRLLTVGTDCALGKKYTALALTRAFGRAGRLVDFRATGQTGILIAGAGIPIDAVVSDFVAGAAELLSPDAPADHWDVIEGQGSIFHPSYAGVSLGLLHGSQPDVIVLCHQLGRDWIMGLEGYPTPSLPEALQLTLALARRTNPRVRCAGISLNTSSLNDEQARRSLADHEVQLGMPVADPVRGGAEFEQLVAACLA
jgi:uncharacterized NAD-dependent epimerase/dehydratase family protein